MTWDSCNDLPEREIQSTKFDLYVKNRIEDLAKETNTEDESEVKENE